MLVILLWRSVVVLIISYYSVKYFDVVVEVKGPELHWIFEVGVSPASCTSIVARLYPVFCMYVPKVPGVHLSIIFDHIPRRRTFNIDAQTSSLFGTARHIIQHILSLVPRRRTFATCRMYHREITPDLYAEFPGEYSFSHLRVVCRLWYDGRE